jgi:hypothetical protein
MMSAKINHIFALIHIPADKMHRCSRSPANWVVFQWTRLQAVHCACRERSVREIIDRAEQSEIVNRSMHRDKLMQPTSRVAQ